MLMLPEDIWSDLEFDNEFDFNESIINEYTEDNCYYKEIYFNGRNTQSGKVKIYGIFARPLKVENPPVVLVCHDYNSTVDSSFIEYFLKMDMAVLMCDTYGISDKHLYTIYPDDIDYANKTKSGTRSIEVDETAIQTMQYEWTMVQRYALRYIKTQDTINSDKIACVGMKQGSMSVWHLSYLEPSITCCVSTFYAGWDYTNDNLDNIDNAKVEFSAGISAESYASLVKVPMLFVTASNDLSSDLIKSFDTMARINGAIKSAMTVSPNCLNNLGFYATRTVRRWLGKYLLETSTNIPEKPILTMSQLDGKILANCAIDDEEDIRSIKLYYSSGERVATRCWIGRDLALTAVGYIGSIDITNSDKKFRAFVNVEYNNGVTVTSNIVEFIPSNYGINQHLPTDRLIYNGIMEKGSFSCVPGLLTNHANDIFSNKDYVHTEEGAFGIIGITSDKNNLTTFKLHDERYIGQKGRLLNIDIYSKENQHINIIVHNSIETGSTDVYSCDLDIVGGDLWQNFKLNISDFKNANKVQLESWEDILMLMINSQTKYIINNILWV